MKSPVHHIASIAVLLLAMGAVSVSADTSQEKALCFQMHGKLMSKPALSNPDACWRVHAYLMNR